jgi:hypothetical protein
MARNLPAHVRRDLRRKRELTPGKSYPVRVSHPVTEGDELRGVVEFTALLTVQADGRTILEPYRGEVLTKIDLARDFFGSFQINRDWWSISAFPVELSRHTDGRTTMTAVVMNHIQVW